MVVRGGVCLSCLPVMTALDSSPSMPFLSYFMPAPPPPPPPPVSLLSATLESKLIALSLLVSIVVLVAAALRDREVRNVAAPQPSPALRSSLPMYVLATGSLLGVIVCPGSIDVLRVLLWSPARALALPPGYMLLVLSAALVLAVSFLSAMNGSPATPAATSADSAPAPPHPDPVPPSEPAGRRRTRGTAARRQGGTKREAEIDALRAQINTLQQRLDDALRDHAIAGSED